MSSNRKEIAGLVALAIAGTALHKEVVNAASATQSVADPNRRSNASVGVSGSTSGYSGNTGGSSIDTSEKADNYSAMTLFYKTLGMSTEEASKAAAADTGYTGCNGNCTGSCSTGCSGTSSGGANSKPTRTSVGSALTVVADALLVIGGLGTIQIKGDSSACNSGCASSCSGCSGSCSGCDGCSGCSGCSNCSGTCTGGCYGHCTGCSCCTTSCTNNCYTNCEDGCSVACLDSCMTTCSDECKNGCTSGCYGTCQGQIFTES